MSFIPVFDTVPPPYAAQCVKPVYVIASNQCDYHPYYSMQTETNEMNFQPTEYGTPTYYVTDGMSYTSMPNSKYPLPYYPPTMPMMKSNSAPMNNCPMVRAPCNTMHPIALDPNNHTLNNEELNNYYYDDGILFNDFNQQCCGSQPYNGEKSNIIGVSNIYNNILYSPGPPIVTSNHHNTTDSANHTKSNEQTAYNNNNTSYTLKGPNGSNLFCFHLPNEITNWDLYLLFRRFGNVLSVHIMINKNTGLSRGFGFISYDQSSSAELAIKEMNGFRLGRKRLKVQRKKDGYIPPVDTVETHKNIGMISTNMSSHTEVLVHTAEDRRDGVSRGVEEDVPVDFMGEYSEDEGEEELDSVLYKCDHAMPVITA